MIGSQQLARRGSPCTQGLLPTPAQAKQGEGSGLAGPPHIRRGKQGVHFPAGLEMIPRIFYLDPSSLRENQFPLHQQKRVLLTAI